MRSVLEFAAAAGLLTVLPGPDSLLTLRTALAQGRTQGISAAAGICTALAGWGCAAAAGLTAALAASPVLYDSLRWAGAAYLAYLGYRALTAGNRWDDDTRARAPAAAGRGAAGRAAAGQSAAGQCAVLRAAAGQSPAGQAAHEASGDDRRPRPQQAGRRSAYLRGVLTDATNPKIGIFYLSLFPLFIPRGTPVLAFGLLLTAIHVAESITWLVLVAVVAGRLGHVFRRRSARRWADRVSGAAFLAFAARLAVGG